jgi:HD-like signal output (HDOD) protein
MAPTLQPITEADVKRYIKNMQDLSTIPVLLGKILKACQDENASASELNKLITFDQALAQRVLRMANSAAFGRSGQVKDIEKAVFFLGFDRIRAIAIGMTVMSMVATKGSFTVENLWIHGYEVGFISSALTDLVPMTSPGECFLSGLLHDIGRIIFCGMDQKKFISIAKGEDMLEWEQTLFGCTHEAAGALFIEELGLPKELALIAKFHHHPELAKEQKDTVAVVALAEGLAGRFNPRPEGDSIWTPALDAIVKQYSITEEDIKGVGEKLAAAMPEIEQVFTQNH